MAKTMHNTNFELTSQFQLLKMQAIRALRGERERVKQKYSHLNKVRKEEDVYAMMEDQSRYAVRRGQKKRNAEGASQEVELRQRNNKARTMHNVLYKRQQSSSISSNEQFGYNQSLSEEKEGASIST